MQYASTIPGSATRLKNASSCLCLHPATGPSQSRPFQLGHGCVTTHLLSTTRGHKYRKWLPGAAVRLSGLQLQSQLFMFWLCCLTVDKFCSSFLFPPANATNDNVVIMTLFTCRGCLGLQLHRAAECSIIPCLKFIPPLSPIHRLTKDEFNCACPHHTPSSHGYILSKFCLRCCVGDLEAARDMHVLQGADILQ